MRYRKKPASAANKRSLSVIAGLLLTGVVTAPGATAEELDRVVFGTNWYAQAEHGGFYQAKATGMQLLVAERHDFSMGYPIGNIKAREQGLPVQTVAAAFQGDPNIVQQGYLSSEPYAIKQGGIEPSVFLLADYGYPAYATTIETTDKMIEDNPDLVRRFVQASMEGWASYFADPTPGNQLIKQENPQMTDEQIAYGIGKMKEHGLVTGGDAETGGIGVMTSARWTVLYDFMVEAELVSTKLDINDVYTLDFLPEEPVLK